jgi:hypothetical protein
MSNHEIRDDRRYTSDHEWALDDGQAIVIGITAFAVDQLGDITLVNIDLAEGDEIETGKAFGTVESVKTLAELYRDRDQYGQTKPLYPPPAECDEYLTGKKRPNLKKKKNTTYNYDIISWV